jgi:ABC-2 type transport system ATP-binding protein
MPTALSEAAASKMLRPDDHNLVIENLVKTYPGARKADRIRALDGISLSIAAGTVYALLGPNGAGKSTTVKILTTLTRPDSGAAAVCGLDVVRDASRVRQQIGLVGQRPSSDPIATGRENLVLAARIQGMPAVEARQRAAELIARFGLNEAADRQVRTYSGGMSRKLDVAIGLVHRPAVLFLDEPTTGLDPQARADMWAEIDDLAGVERMTVLLTTHYLDEADRLADRLAIIDHGRVVVEGTPDALKSELHGDTLQVDIAESGRFDDARAVLAGLGELTSLQIHESGLRARTSVGARVVGAVVNALELAGIDTTSVMVSRPSLDDVYLRHVGRALELGEEQR